jgi:hypothetical protein
MIGGKILNDGTYRVEKCTFLLYEAAYPLIPIKG